MGFIINYRDPRVVGFVGVCMVSTELQVRAELERLRIHGYEVTSTEQRTARVPSAALV
jgi:hypothetical protein